MRDRVVWLAALAAVLARFPSAMWPLRPDEAGFLLVARSWDPQPDSLYGRYFVDRPPPIIALMKLTDAVGGPYFHRVLGAVGCALLVLAAAAAAREVAHQAGLADVGDVRRVVRWTAVATAALVANAEIDAVAVKGELLGIVPVLAACWLALRAVRLHQSSAAFAAGLLAVLAMGLKQSLVGGFVFGGAVLLGALLTRRLAGGAFARLALAVAVGAAVPMLATVGWALAAGVQLETLAYTVIGFRSEASAVLANQPRSEGAEARVGTMVDVVIGTGILLVLAWYLMRLPRLLQRLPVPTVAAALLLLVDGAVVVLSGSFWLPYLFALLPGLSLATACVLAGDQREDRAALPGLTKVVVSVTVVASMLSLAGWLAWWVPGRTAVETEIGTAIARAARPGDTLVVFGGRADVQWASGLPSPYNHLWSLPMRTLDPRYADLRSLMTGQDPPTWIVEVVDLRTWTELGVRPIERSLLAKYEFVVTACDHYRVYHLNTVNPVELDLDCESTFRFVF